MTAVVVLAELLGIVCASVGALRWQSSRPRRVRHLVVFAAGLGLINAFRDRAHDLFGPAANAVTVVTIVVIVVGRVAIVVRQRRAIDARVV